MNLNSPSELSTSLFSRIASSTVSHSLMYFSQAFHHLPTYLSIYLYKSQTIFLCNSSSKQRLQNRTANNNHLLLQTCGAGQLQRNLQWARSRAHTQRCSSPLQGFCKKQALKNWKPVASNPCSVCRCSEMAYSKRLQTFSLCCPC